MTIDKNPMCHSVVHMESSIVITTIKERKPDLFELLHCITHQEVKPFEVIVVCDGKITVPMEIITKYKELGMRFILIKVSAGLTLGTTRNVGIKKTKAKYVYFLDDDALPTQRWLIEIKKSLEAGAAIVGGVSRPLFKRSFKKPVWWDEALMGPYVAVGNQYIKFKHNGIWGCNFAIRKDAIEKIGYFDEGLGLRKSVPKLLGEDSEFVKRAVRNGLIVQFNPFAEVYHKLDANRISLAYIRMRAWRIGRTAKELNKKYRSYTNVAFFKEMLFKAFRGPYFVLIRKSKATALPLYMIMLLYEVIGWLGIRLE